MQAHRDSALAGMGFATTAYAVWGVVPIYWKSLPDISALEALAPRVICTGLLMLGILLVTRRTQELREFGRAGLLRASLASALLCLNWLTFIYAVQIDQVIATSLGYYINPLVSTLLGLFVLGERINKVQGSAVGVAGLGVAYLTLASGGLPWIAGVLALSFGLYGLLHKMAPSPPLAGLSVEMWLATPLALLSWLWLASRGEASLIDATVATRWLVAASGIVTALPLLCFHAATRRLPLYAVGMFQYIAPTCTLLLAVLVYGEPFTTAHAICFACVWTGLAIFTGDSIIRARSAKGDTESTPG